MKSSWTRILTSSVVVSAAALTAGAFWQTEALGLLIAQFFLGALAGWFARRYGWLSGIIVGLPFGLQQLTRGAAREYPTVSNLLMEPDYWRLIVPVSVVSCGMAILGALAGAWMQDMRLQRDTPADG